MRREDTIARRGGIDDTAMLLMVIGKEVPAGGTVFEVHYSIIAARNAAAFILP